MKNFIFIFCILIILFKTGNVLSDNNIFNVNNIEINKDISKNKENLVSQAFRGAFDELINRLLLKKDRLYLSNTNLKQIKELILYYQIINPTKNNDDLNKFKVNVFFDKDKIHNFFYKKNILYSDIINTDIVLFPLLKKKNQYYIYSKNFFYENWNKKKNNNLLQYILPLESIESIQKINLKKDNIFDFDIVDFFKEYDSPNKVFAIIEIDETSAEVILKTIIAGKKINKTLSVTKKVKLNSKIFYENIILEIKETVTDLLKSQNLIDVRTPTFLNVKIQLKNKINLLEFSNRIKKIDLIDDFYVQQLNKDHVLIKIKFLGKIKKIISKLKDQKIDLKMNNGQWQINII